MVRGKGRISHLSTMVLLCFFVGNMSYMWGLCCWKPSSVNTPKVQPFKRYQVQQQHAAAHTNVALQVASASHLQSSTAKASSLTEQHTGTEQETDGKKASTAEAKAAKTSESSTTAIVVRTDHETQDSKDAKPSEDDKGSSIVEKMPPLRREHTWRVTDFAQLSTLVILPDYHVGCLCCHGREAKLFDLETRKTIKTFEAPEYSKYQRFVFFPAAVVTAGGYLVAPLYFSEEQHLGRKNNADDEASIDPRGRLPYCKLSMWDITPMYDKPLFLHQPLPTYDKKILNGEGTLPWDFPCTFTKDSAYTSELAYVCALTLCPDGRVVSAMANGALSIWDPETRMQVRTILPTYEERVCVREKRKNYHTEEKEMQREICYVERMLSSVCALTNRYIACGFYDGKVEIVDLHEDRRLIIKSHRKPITAIASLMNGAFATGSSDSTVKVWVANEGGGGFTCVQTLENLAEVVSLVSIRLRDGCQLFALDKAGCIHVWRGTASEIAAH